MALANVARVLELALRFPLRGRVVVLERSEERERREAVADVVARGGSGTGARLGGERRGHRVRRWCSGGSEVRRWRELRYEQRNEQRCCLASIGKLRRFFERTSRDLYRESVRALFC